MELSTNISEEQCHLDCHLGEREKAEFNTIAIVRLITALLSILGALSIICSAVYRRTVCNPKVHPIFVLSVVDTLLSVLWMSGAVVWLAGGLSGHHNKHRAHCFAINCITVILQCVAMNVTLIYSLLAYFSIKQSRVYMVRQRPVSVHVWRPLCSFTAYFIAWILPVFLTMVPFGVIAQQYKIIEKANNCSCWCLATKLWQYFTSATVGIYKWKKRNANAPLYGAAMGMILAGQKDAKKRVFLFFTIYVTTGLMTQSYGVANIVVFNFIPSWTRTKNFYKDEEANYIYLLLEAILVPSQGFMNAVAYGWTRGDFLSVMSRRQHNRPRPNSLTTSYGTVEEGEEEGDKEETEGESEREDGENELFMETGERRQRVNTALTPVSPGGLLRDV